MGRITCPLLLVYGEDDQGTATKEVRSNIALTKPCKHLLIIGVKPGWSNKVDFGSMFCPQISKMMHDAGNEHLLTVLPYLDTGHFIEPPYTPPTIIMRTKFFGDNTVKGNNHTCFTAMEHKSGDVFYNCF